jgi:thiamine transporter
MAISAGGLCLALAETLSLIKVFEMPQGGSVTPASMLPIILFSLCFGPGWGLGVAFCYSLLQTFIGGFVVSIPQALLDYTVAFTGLGLAGFFAAKKSVRIEETNILRRLKLIPFWRIVLATVTAFAVRLISAFLAGIIFWADYTPEGQTVWGYSLAYNGSFLLPEAVITVVALLALLGTLMLRVKTAERMSAASWAITVLVSLIPVVGQIFLIVWSFDTKAPRGRRTYSRVFLGFLLLTFLAWIVLSLQAQQPYNPFL